MKYILDTNVCINFLKGSNNWIAQNIVKVSSNDRIIPSVVRAELYYGVFKSTRKEENLTKLQLFLQLHPSLPFDDKASEIFGQIRSDLEKIGKPIGPYDLQIASIAIANHCTLVTHNTKEFSRIPGLQLTDWEIESSE